MAEHYEEDADCLLSCMKATMPSETKLILRNYDRNKEILALQTLFICKFAFLCKLELFEFIQQEKKKEYSKLILETPFPKHLKFVIGIIGCGSMGKRILEKLHLPGISPFQSHQILVSTRRPNLLFEQLPPHLRQIETCFDNGFVAQHANILILSVLPSQLHLVASEIKSHLQQQTNTMIVISVVAGVSKEKLIQLLNIKQVITLHIHNASETIASVKGISTVKSPFLPMACPIQRNIVEEDNQSLEIIGELFGNLVSHFDSQISLVVLIRIIVNILLGVDFEVEKIAVLVKDKSNVGSYHKTLDFLQKLFVTCYSHFCYKSKS